MKRLKAFFTPGVSVVDGPPSKVLVFNPDNVVFETTYPEDRGGKVVKVKATQEIDEMPQYILDGMTPTSEKKFRSIYPESLGNDPRSKRAKTIIGGHDDQGVLIGKHQEMTMYVPQGTKMRILDGDKVIAEIYSNGTTTDIYVDGKYVDHLMTENEAKIRLGENFDKMGEVIELPSEATTHIQSVGPPKNTANFPMQ